MKWIGYITDHNYDLNNRHQQYGMPSTYIVRKFSLTSFNNVKIRIAALGVYSLYVNGVLVNDDFMTQDLSEYDQVIYYRQYNITKYLHVGDNAIGIILSDGWYASNLSQVGKNIFGDYPLKVHYEIYDDKTLLLESDGSEFANDGAIRKCDNQNGIFIDNNRVLKGFSLPNSDISSWNKVNIYEINTPIKRSIIPPVIKHKVLKPRLINTFDNHYIYDFGQNITGVTHTIFKGNKGSKIIIKHGEMLTDNNKLYTDNLRTALATDTYILSGNGEEEFLPRHTFHGFRYIEITIEGDAELLFLEGVAIGTKMKRIGYLKTNNRLVNKLYSNILWGQRDNFLSIPTDCPQRDERMGWTGDAQIFSSTAMYNYDVSKFFKKYLRDIEVSMKLYGNKIPNFVPFFFRRVPEINDQPFNWMFDSEGWASVIFILPLNMYLYYGDKKILKESLIYMKKHIKHIEKYRIQDGLYNGHSFGDWLSVIETTDIGLYDNAYLAYDYYLLSLACHILNDKDEELYHQKYLKTRELFRQKYLIDNKLVSDTQGAYILAFAFGLLEKEEIQDNLIRKMEQFGHLTTGFHSTKHLLPTLTKLGRTDLAYKLLNSKKYPSWGYMISCGATTIWERWDSYKKDTGFNKDGMNSFNHYSLGSVGEWLYSTVVGISPSIDEPGFKKTIVSPRFDRSITNLSCLLKTVNGDIKVKYHIKDDVVTYEISGNKKIRFSFNFINKLIEEKQIDNNKYIFKLSL